MNEDIAISMKDVSKVYRLYKKPIDRLKEMLFLKPYHNEFVALNGLNIRVKKGETLGIIGENGAGKSTLLKIIARTLKPTNGEVNINGMVSSLLELGSGFHPEFTGIDNIFFYGSLLGIPPSEMKGRVAEVVSFAEIGEHINYPLKTYSSGMHVRLAFSVAMAVEPDILVVDEALSVGDLYFQKKSTDKILSVKEKGKTIIFCSHSMYYINRLCDRVVWLKNGLSAMEGSAHEVTQAYETYQLKKEAAKIGENPQTVRVKSPATASSSIVMHDVILTPFPTVRSGDDLTVGIEIMASDASVPYRLAAVLFRIDELRIIGISTKDHEPLYGSRKITLCFPSLQLKEGTFFLKIHVMDENYVHIYDSKATSPFTVPKENMDPGFINIPYKWTI
jgi:ABC-type polysaccharide/polyol phosphate transport system ATPase subunit